MNTEVTTELISHPLCPYNQRLALAHIRLGKVRGKDFHINYVDLANLPDWFLVISPQKAMPVLRSEGGKTDFDVDGILAGLTKAFENREISADEANAGAVSDDLLNAMRVMFTESEVEAVNASVASVMEKLRSISADAAAIERIKTNQGDLREVVYAPVFSLLFANPGLVEQIRQTQSPVLVEYGQRLANHPQTHESRCADYQKEFEKFFALFDAAYPAWQEQQQAALVH